MTESCKLGKQKRSRIKRERNTCQPIAISGKKWCKKCQPVFFSEKALKDELMQQMKALGVPVGVVETVAEKIANAVSAWVEKRAVVTSDDVSRRVALEAKKYNADLAYVYQNRGKII